MHVESNTGIDLMVMDVSGQKRRSVRNVPPDASVGEVVRGLLESLQLPEQDSSGREVHYAARLEREGRHLHASEQIGAAFHGGPD